MIAYRNFCESNFPASDGQPNREINNIRDALRPLYRLYGDTVAAEFGPRKLQTLLQEFVKLGWSRNYINHQLSRVKTFFKWAVAQELIPSSIYHGLQAVGGIKKGRTSAPENEKVRPVDESHVEMIKPHVSRQVWAMIQLQLLTGMRPGEAVIMRGRDLDTTGKQWRYMPSKHKTAHHGIDRQIPLGPKAREIVEPFLRTDVDAFLFSPVEAEAERRAQMHDRRKTPLTAGNKPGSNRSRAPRRTPGQRYTRESYTRAIARGCALAFPYPAELVASEEDAADVAESKEKGRAAWRESHYWSPNQLRHTAATRFRRLFNAEAAQTMLGHTRLKTTEIYAERDNARAEEIMEKIG